MRPAHLCVLILLASCTRFPQGTRLQQTTLSAGDAIAIANGIAADFGAATSNWLEQSCIPAEQLRDSTGPERDQAFSRCRQARSRAQFIHSKLREAGEYLDKAEAYWLGLSKLQIEEGDEQARELVSLIQMSVADAVALIWVLRESSREVEIPQSADRALVTLRGIP